MLLNSHHWQCFSNETLYWLKDDSKDLWQRNMLDADKRAHLEMIGMDSPTSITYKFNSHGFRSDNFNGEPGFIALGCSFTAGTALPIEQVWPSIVGHKTNLIPWNLGISGASLDTCFRFLLYYIDIIKPKFVLVLRPDRSRFEIACTYGFKTIFSAMPDLDDELQTLKKLWLTFDVNHNVQQQKNTYAIQHVCDVRNVPVFFKDVETDLLGCIPHKYRWPCARDLKHVGFEEQTHVANLFLSDLRTNNVWPISK